MQEEATQKTIALVFRATYFTAKHFEAVLREAKRDLEHQQNKIQTRRAQSRASRPRRPREQRPRQRHGQMTVSQLVGQGQGASTMTIPYDIRAFERIARRYNVDFAIQRDRSVQPPKYTVFFKAKDTDVRKTVGDDFFILPSSIHETLIVPKTDDMSLENLEKMVREVNATEVKPGERLSDHVYEYDAEERSIVRADKVEERRQEKETMQKDVKTVEERAGNPEKASAREGKIDRDEGRVSFKQKLPEMKEKAAEQTKANPVAENAKKKAQEIA